MFVKTKYIVLSIILCAFGLAACGGAPVKDQSKESAAAAANAALVVGDSSNTYRLSPGDTINITVFGEPDLTLDVVLNASGTFNYSYLGSLNILNKTLAEVQTLITEGLKDGFLIDPKVSVTMDSFREVFIGGEVELGGNFPYQPGLTVGKAVVLARGFTERASRNNIFVVSEGAESSKPIKVSLDYVLKPGDVVTVQRRFF